MQDKAGTIAFVGVGSNLGDPAQNVRSGIAAIARIPDTDVVKTSSLYGSPPMGPPEQPDYVNAVVELNTRLSAGRLLEELFEIERRHGRERGDARWGPRTLDLDILLFGDAVCDDEQLTIPHAGITLRAFVLWPLQELEPDLRIPGEPPLAELIARHPDGRVWRL
jgi:2-amino-4-hydroxy-6-hydroxymethyldihydropteridine diphosphokinase